MYPADVVLFEGILMFYSQEIRDLFHMKLFVDTDADTRLSRRGKPLSVLVYLCVHRHCMKADVIVIVTVPPPIFTSAP